MVSANSNAGHSLLGECLCTTHDLSAPPPTDVGTVILRKVFVTIGAPALPSNRRLMNAIDARNRCTRLMHAKQKRRASSLMPAASYTHPVLLPDVGTPITH